MNSCANRCGGGCSSLSSGFTVRPDQVKALLGLQVVLILVVGLAYLMAVGYFPAVSAVYGGAMAVFGAWMLARRVRLAMEVAKNMPGREVGVLHRGTMQRFVFMLALFIIGMAALGLEPAPLLIGFAVPQGAFLLAARFHGSHAGCHQ